MTFTQSIATCFKKYATFKGRASRSEFWWFQLFQFLASIVIVTLVAILQWPKVNPDSPLMNLIGTLFTLVTFIPNLAVTCRRLHDTDHSGWWMLMPYGVILVSAFICVILVIVFKNSGFPLFLYFCAAIIAYIRILIWLIDSSDWGENKYGPSPFLDEETELDTTTEETDIQSNN